VVEENLTADYADNTDQDGPRKARVLPQRTQRNRKPTTIFAYTRKTALNDPLLLEQPEENLTADYADNSDWNERNTTKSFFIRTSSKYLQEHATAIVKW
jgi:hypothetical protein